MISLLQRGVVRGYAGAAESIREIREVEFADATIVHTNEGHVVAISAFPSDAMGLGGHFDRLRIVGRDLTREMPPINLGVAEFMSRQDGPIEYPSPNDAGSRFDPHANTMLIGEAALWVGAQGQAFSNSVARTDRFEQIGVPRLFAALALREMEATGLNAQLRREPIPADVWAECDYGDGQDGKHHFSFIDEMKKNEIGGSIRLWPYLSKESPDWCDIRLPSSMLLSVFGTAGPQGPQIEDSALRPGRGRPEGTGKDDSGALRQVRSLLSQGLGKMQAVRQVAATLQHDGTVESTEKRLLRKLAANSSR